jgi:hypothetical protein
VIFLGNFSFVRIFLKKYRVTMTTSTPALFKHGTISQYIKIYYLQKQPEKSDLPIGRVLTTINIQTFYNLTLYQSTLFYPTLKTCYTS